MTDEELDNLTRLLVARDEANEAYNALVPAWEAAGRPARAPEILRLAKASVSANDAWDDAIDDAAPALVAEVRRLREELACASEALALSEAGLQAEAEQAQDHFRALGAACGVANERQAEVGRLRAERDELRALVEEAARMMGRGECDEGHVRASLEKITKKYEEDTNE